MATITTPNMGMALPIPGLEPGPTYASDNNTAFEVIDSHDHQSGKGLPVPSAGLNINADLPFNQNAITDVGATAFTNLVADSTGLNRFWVKSGEVYYTDGSGNKIQLTAGGAINVGTTGQISGMTGSASVVFNPLTGVYTFQQSSGVGGGLDVGPVVIREAVAGAKKVTLNSPSSLAADTNLTLPTIPAGLSLLEITNTGIIKAAGPGMIPSIATYLAMASNGSIVFGRKVGIVAQKSASSGNFITGSTSFTDVLDGSSNPLSITVTTGGNPMIIFCESDDSAGASFRATDNASGTAQGEVQVVVSGDATAAIGLVYYGASVIGPTNCTYVHAPSIVNTFYAPGFAGTFTFTLQIRKQIGLSASAVNVKLVAYEL